MTPIEHQIDIPDCPLSGRTEVYSVRLWRPGLDDQATWLENLWLTYVYRPFLRFSRRRFRIPAPAKMTKHPDGTETYEWFEDIGVHTEEGSARAALEGELWQMKPLPLNVNLPEGSCQYQCTAQYPKSKRPVAYRKPFAIDVTLHSSADELLRQTARLKKAVNA